MGKNPAEKAKQKLNETKAEKKTSPEGTIVKSGAKGKVKKKKVVATAAAAENAHGDKHCKVKACKRSYRAKGYCGVHYKKWRHGEYGSARYKTCKDGVCMKPMAKNRHGYCEDHFQNYYVKGMEVSKVDFVEAAPVAKPAAEKKEAAA